MPYELAHLSVVTRTYDRVTSQRPTPRRRRRRAHRGRQPAGRRGPGRNSPADYGQSVGRFARKLSPGRAGRAHVDKIRYNPGHFYHHEREKPWQDKVRYLADIAGEQRLRHAHRRQLRLASIRPSKRSTIAPTRSRRCSKARSTIASCSIELGFTRYCVSLKDSDPPKVIEVNRRFAEARPDVPLHLGVTEAGPAARRHHQNAHRLRAAHQPRHRRHDSRLAHRAQRSQSRKRSPPAGRFSPTSPPAASARVVDYGLQTLNIISCPSCSRVENEAFIELAAAGEAR